MEIEDDVSSSEDIPLGVLAAEKKKKKKNSDAKKGTKRPRSKSKKKAESQSIVIRHVPSILWVPGDEARLAHLPQDVISLVLSYLSIKDILAFRRVNLFAQDCAVRYLRNVAQRRFDAADHMAVVLAARFEQNAEIELNKGDAKIAFRLQDKDLKDVPHRVEHHFRWSQHWYRVDALMKVALQRHGNIATLWEYDSRLTRNGSNLSKAAEKREAKAVRRRLLLSKLEEKEVVLDMETLPGRVRQIVQKFFAKGEDDEVDEVAELVAVRKELEAYLECSIEEIPRAHGERSAVQACLEGRVTLSSTKQKIDKQRKYRVDRKARLHKVLVKKSLDAEMDLEAIFPNYVFGGSLEGAKNVTTLVERVLDVD